MKKLLLKIPTGVLVFIFFLLITITVVGLQLQVSKLNRTLHGVCTAVGKIEVKLRDKNDLLVFKALEDINKICRDED
jgi:hypothetical protein